MIRSTWSSTIFFRVDPQWFSQMANCEKSISSSYQLGYVFWWKYFFKSNICTVDSSFFKFECERDYTKVSDRSAFLPVSERFWSGLVLTRFQTFENCWKRSCKRSGKVNDCTLNVQERVWTFESGRNITRTRFTKDQLFFYFLKSIEFVKKISKKRKIIFCILKVSFLGF